jgi:hypothetical protein
VKAFLALLTGAALVGAAGTASATVYTSDGDITHFEAASYATFSNFFSGDVGSPYTPTNATIGDRVYDGGGLPGLSGGNNWILATFSKPTSAIRVFPNIDHYGSQYDGYQYTIEGSNDGSTWTPLFDALSVVGGSEPFTLGGFTGTAPVRVNNVLSPGAGPNGWVGYIADFKFGGAYKYYAFGASTVAFAQGNSDQELSAVSAMGVPEPGTWAMMLLGIGAIGMAARRRKAAAAAA